MDEYWYSTRPRTHGAKFAYKGRLMTKDYHIGTSSGQCIIISAENVDSAICDFHLEFHTDGGYGRGILTMSGNTDDKGGYMQVTGTGGDLPYSPGGTAVLNFDPAGNPVIYILLRLDSL